jgi:hypothetical protein
MGEPFNETHVCIECGREEENTELCSNCGERVCEHCWIEKGDRYYCCEDCVDEE